MRAFRLVNFGILATLIASSAVLYAQDDKPQENKPRQEEPRQQEPSRETKPESRQDEMKPPRQDEAKPARPEQQEHPQEQRQGEKPSREETRPAQQEPSRPEAGRQESGREESGRQEAGRQEAGQQQGHARPSGRSGRIPDDRFRAQFGRGHTFRAQRPVVVEGEPRFEYGGYTFVLVDPWPEDWAYTDDCYIDYVDGGYFLYDMLHPGMRIALFVVM
jgi:hypothetical protein